MNFLKYLFSKKYRYYILLCKNNNEISNIISNTIINEVNKAIKQVQISTVSKLSDLNKHIKNN